MTQAVTHLMASYSGATEAIQTKREIALLPLAMTQSDCGNL